MGLKGVKMAQNIMKVGVHGYLSNGLPNLLSNFNYTKLLKSETSSCFFARVGLKGGQNSLERCESLHVSLFI